MRELSEMRRLSFASMIEFYRQEQDRVEKSNFIAELKQDIEDRILESCFSEQV